MIQATTDRKRGITLSTGDRLNGQTSRIDVAAVCVACLSHPETKHKSLEIINQGERTAQTDWTALFAQL
ncbi:MAG: hypothetical protein F6J97_15305 [Leptolyngbya sp. SIO4C1]|nr:hypothetical protein [Leptolyngbya sp. SIO4C1]